MASFWPSPSTCMSILFVFMFYARPDLRGLSYSVAWLTMLGTLCESILCVRWMPAKHPEITNFSFFYFLYITTCLFDCIYVARGARYLHTRCPHAPAAPQHDNGVVRLHFALR